MDPITLMAVGTGMQIFSQVSANFSNAKAAVTNAKFLEKQADFARSAMFRSIRIAEQEYSAKYGQQMGAFAAGNVDVGSGSAALMAGNTLAAGIEELYAIRKRGELDMELARSRAQLERREAAQLTSFQTNFMQSGATFLNAYTGSEGFGKGFPNGMNPGNPPPSGAGQDLKYFPTSSSMNYSDMVGRTA